MIYKLLFAYGSLLFTLEHPLFVALSCVFYLLNEHITEEDKTMLKDYVSKGTVWLKELNQTSVNAGVKMSEGREVAAQYMDSIFSHFNPEQIKTILSNTFIQDKVAKTINDELMVEDNIEDLWKFNDPLNNEEVQEVDEEELEFINHFVPEFDPLAPYTYKAHRQLFKKLKAALRNSDGSIKDELANTLVIYLEGRLFSHSVNDSSYIPEIPEDDVWDYLENKTYKTVKLY